MEKAEVKKALPGYNTITSLFEIVYKHPILTAVWACMLCMTMHSSQVTVLGLLCPAVVITALGIMAAVCYYGRHRDKDGKRFGIIIAVSSAAAAAIFCFLVGIRGSYAITVMDCGLAAVGAVFLILAATGRLNTKNVILLLFAAGFIMRLSYILTLNIYSIQHDVGSFNFENPGNGTLRGHAGYIQYLYTYGHLPSFDVRKVDQYYHPPLHHIIAALWLRVQTTLGMDIKSACENIQALTLFYSTVCFILSYKIFRRVGLKKSGLITATAVIAFCPTFYIMAGSINNDILSIAFMLGAFYNTICWYKSRRMSRMICIALCVGLGMFTKLSVWMVAPPIAFIFIYVFFTELKSFKKYLCQFAAFLGVCVPIGLFWSVRNLIRFGVPMTYIQQLSEYSGQYVGNFSLTDRLFYFGKMLFTDVSEQFVFYGGGYNEFNPIVGLFKTSAFDEGIAVRNFPMINGFSHVLFWSAVVLGLAGFVAMLYMLLRKDNPISMPVRVSIGMFYFLLLGMYYYFCFSFPQVCTMNIRYCVPVIVIGALSLGFAVFDLLRGKKLWQRITGIAICTGVGIYAMSGFMVFRIVAQSKI